MQLYPPGTPISLSHIRPVADEKPDLNKSNSAFAKGQNPGSIKHPKSRSSNAGTRWNISSGPIRTPLAQTGSNLRKAETAPGTIKHLKSRSGMGKKKHRKLLAFPIQSTQHTPVDFRIWSAFHYVTQGHRISSATLTRTCPRWWGS